MLCFPFGFIQAVLWKLPIEVNLSYHASNEFRLVPSGMSIRHEPDAGPATGKRRPPEAFNTEPVNLDPVRAETVEERLRSVRIRRSC